MSGNDNTAERDLVCAAKAGDQTAFNRLIESHYNRIYFAAFARIGNTAEAEDIAQEVFIAAYLSLNSLENPAQFSLWLFSITRNICGNRIRLGIKESRILKAIPSELRDMDRSRPIGGKTALERAVSREETVRLHEAIQRLDSDLREIVLLRYAEDMNNTEIGLQLGLPHYTVSRRLDKACQLLREILENENLSCLAKLKPGREATAKAIALTAAVSAMSEGAKAALLTSFGDVIPVLTGETAGAVSQGVAKAISAHNPVAAGGGKSFMGKILGTAAGKMAVAAVCVGGLVFAGNNLAGRYDKSLGADKTLSAGKNDPESGRHNGVGKNRRGAGGSSNAAGTDSASRIRGSGSLTSSPALSKKDNTLTCPMVMISGKVTFEDGRPADSAGVELWQNGATYMGEQVSERLMARQPVGSDGSYRISAPDGTGIRLELKNAARAVADIKVADTPTSAPIVRTLKQDFVIPAMHTVKGKVVWDDSGEAVAGAKVSLRTHANKSAGWYYGNDIVLTNESGGFEIPNVATGKADIGAIAEKTAPAFQVINVPLPGGDEIVLRLKKATGTIAGELRLMPDETPVAGATITVNGSEISQKLKLTKSRSIKTDVKGNFEIDHLGDENLILSATDNSGLTLFNFDNSSSIWKIQGKDNQNSLISLNCILGYLIRGKITDKETGEPIAGVAVECKDFEGKQKTVKSVSDEHGDYTLNGVMPGKDNKVILFFEKAGYRLARGIYPTLAYPKNGLKLSTIYHELLPLPDPTTVNAQMRKTTTVSGKVTNRFGIGVANAEIRYLETLGDNPSFISYTSNTGHYTMESLVGRAYSVVATAPGYSIAAKSEVLVPKSGLDGLDFRLENESGISGRVTDMDGNRIDPIYLSLVPVKNQSGNPSIISSDNKFYHQRISITTGKHGEYRWAGIEPGQYEMTIAKEGFLTTKTQPFIVEPGKNLEGMDYVLDKDNLLKLSGKIVFENGEAVKSHIPLRIRNLSNNSFNNVSINNGEIDIRSFDHNTNYMLTVTLSNHDTITTTVQFKDKDESVILKIPNTIFKDYILTFHDRETSAPISDITIAPPYVAVRGEGLKENEVVCGLPKGNLNIGVMAPGYPDQRLGIDTKKVSDNKIDLLLSKGVKVRGKVVDEISNEPIANTVLRFSGSLPNDDFVRAETDAQGGFEILAPPADYAYVYVELPKGYVPLKLYVGHNKFLADQDWGTLYVAKSQSAKIRLLDENGKPIQNVEASISKVLSDSLHSMEVLEKVKSDDEGIVEFPSAYLGKNRLYLKNIKGGNYSLLINISESKDKVPVLRLGSVKCIFSTDKIFDKSKNFIDARFTGTQGNFVDYFDFGPDSEGIQLSPGEWDMKITHYDIPKPGEKQQRKVIYNEKIIIPDVPVFEKHFILP